jgi:hypothetical protein
MATNSKLTDAERSALKQAHRLLGDNCKFSDRLLNIFTSFTE